MTVSNLVVEADTIAIATRDGLPMRIEADGRPIRFYEQVKERNIDGTAARVVFEVPELRLTLFDYSILDPSGNNMKGKKASFELSP